MMCIFNNFVAISLAALVCMQADTVSGSIDVPPYTKYADNILQATVVLENDLNPQLNSHAEEFLKVYVAVLDLADQVDKKGKDTYPEFYMETVKNAVEKVEDNPNDASNNLWFEVRKTTKSLQKMLSFILAEQSAKCDVPISSECDMIVEEGIMKYPSLRKRVPLLIAGGQHGEEFMVFSQRFKSESANGAEIFLVSESEVMEPLVLAAYETLKTRSIQN